MHERLTERLLNELPYCVRLGPIDGRNYRTERGAPIFLPRRLRGRRFGSDWSCGTPIEQFDPILVRHLDRNQSVRSATYDINFKVVGFSI